MANKLRTIEMERALLYKLDPRQNLIVPNVSWGIWVLGAGPLHECDLLSLSKSNYATEIEIKITKAGIRDDKKKYHGHAHKLIRRLFFAVPLELKDFALQEIPEHAGLYTVSRSSYDEWYDVELVKNAKTLKYAIKWNAEQRYALARLGTLRILNLKTKIIQLQNGN